ncbi:hypothetical protein Vi05172_g7095 [Venturia inaequalis]|nr:hypothetical protein Vi05172_g7095 [Venturia inaequalis]
MVGSIPCPCDEFISDHPPGIPVPFNGPVPNFVMNKWTSEHFVTILAGQTTESIIDLSTTYELSSGEKYSVAVNSIVHHAQPDSNDIVASIPYQTNTISLDIPQGIAQRSAIGPKLQKRVRYFPDCSPQQLSNLTRASFLGSTWAGAGALEALKKNSPVWQRYFRINASTEGATTEMLTKFHSVVSIRLANVAFELSSGLVSEIHCQSDINTPSQFQQGNFDLCAVYPGQAIAYTIRPTCQIALCPLYWKLENNNADCMSAGMKGGFEQTGILIHELTHCNTIGQVGVQPSTDDLAYDFDDTINDEFVTAGTSVQNAQSHALFAKASHVGGKKC